MVNIKDEKDFNIKRIFVMFGFEIFHIISLIDGISNSINLIYETLIQLLVVYNICILCFMLQRCIYQKYLCSFHEGHVDNDQFNFNNPLNVFPFSLLKLLYLVYLSISFYFMVVFLPISKNCPKKISHNHMYLCASFRLIGICGTILAVFMIMFLLIVIEEICVYQNIDVVLMIKDLFGWERVIFWRRRRRNVLPVVLPSTQVVYELPVTNTINIEQFTKITATQPSKDTMCPICLVEACELNVIENWIESQCKHKFHKNCMQNWLQISKDCPLCRNPIK